jgi:predicted flap endonuclease-1-like 5' DNA nuclease
VLELIEANWLVFVIVLAIGVLVAWWLFRKGSTVERARRPDALDEGSPPASRNQALIDAPPASELAPPATAGTMAGIGEAVAVAAQDEVEEQASRAAETQDEAAPAADAGPADDLSRIKGVGPKLVTLLNSLGITRYEQIAGWNDEDLDRIDAQLGAFAGRPRRDSWVEQARLLASGDTTAYEAKFGKL